MLGQHAVPGFFPAGARTQDGWWGIRFSKMENHSGNPEWRGERRFYLEKEREKKNTHTHFFKHVMRSIPDIKWWVSHGFSSHHIPDISQPQPRHIHGSFSQSDHPPAPSTKAWWIFEVVVTPKKIETCFQDGMHDIYLIFPGCQLFDFFWGFATF